MLHFRKKLHSYKRQRPPLSVKRLTMAPGGVEYNCPGEHTRCLFIWYTRDAYFQVNLTLELTQTLHAQNDKENGLDLHNSVFPGEAKMCLGFMTFRALPAALKQKN